MIAVLALFAFATPQGGPAPAAARTPIVTVASIDATVGSAIDWLVANQNEDGSFGSHESPRPIEVLASIPGSQDAFRVATTALCVMALSDAGAGSDRAAQAADKALAYLIENSAVKRQSGLEHYNVWAFGYALQCFGEHLAKNPEDPRANDIKAASAKLVEKLGIYQSLDGGWGYLSLSGVPTMQPSGTSMSFTTATILVGLDRARTSGTNLPEALKARAVQEIKNCRLPDGAFLYGDYLKFRPRHGVNVRAGSACRASACLYALDLFGEPVTAAEYERALEDLLVRYPDYQKAGLRRPIPHESHFAISGYFYLYGHCYAAYTLEKLAPASRKRWASAIVEAVMVTREPDGSFWDYPLYSYHKPYGTAFALLALARAREALRG